MHTTNNSRVIISFGETTITFNSSEQLYITDAASANPPKVIGNVVEYGV